MSDTLENIRKLQREKYLKSKNEKKRKRSPSKTWQDASMRASTSTTLNSMEAGSSSRTSNCNMSHSDNDEDTTMEPSTSTFLFNSNNSLVQPKNKKGKVAAQPCIVQSDPRLQWLLGNLSTPPPSSEIPLVNACNTSIGECHERTPNNFIDPELLKILSWNIDGLEARGIISRTKAVIQTILVLDLDFVYLQEVVDLTERLIQESLSTKYHIVKPSVQFSYYCLILIRKDHWNVISNDTDVFKTSIMGRHLISVICQSNSNKKRGLRLMTSHLESLKTYLGFIFILSGEERKNQLADCFDRMLEPLGGEYDLVIFGGDLNARDTEVKAVLKRKEKFQTIKDCWETSGSKLKTKFTWDCELNDNKIMDGPFKARCRFDRLYYYQPSNASEVINPVSFELIGEWRLQNGMFPSDHFGILFIFKFLERS